MKDLSNEDSDTKDSYVQEPENMSQSGWFLTAYNTRSRLYFDLSREDSHLAAQNHTPGLTDVRPNFGFFDSLSGNVIFYMIR